MMTVEWHIGPRKMTRPDGASMLAVLLTALAISACAPAHAYRNPELNAGYQALLKRDYDVAIDNLTKAINSGDLYEGELADAYEFRGAEYAKKGETERAMADFSKAIELDPSRATSYSNRAQLNLQLGKGDLALSDANRAIDLDSTSASFYLTRAQVYAALGRSDLASADSDMAMKQKPSAITCFVRGYKKFQSGDFAASVDDFDRAVEMEPNLDEAYLFRGEAHSRMFQLELAVADYTLALDRKTSRPDQAHNGRCYALAQVGKTEEALRDCDIALQIAPANPAILDSRGYANLKASRYAAAIRDYDAALKIKPDIATSLYGRGIAKLRNGDAASGQADIDAAVKAQPDIAALAGKLGLVR